MEDMIETLNMFLTNLLTTVTDLSGYAVAIAVVYLIVQFVMYLVPWIIAYLGVRIVVIKLYDWSITPKVTHTHLKTQDLNDDIDNVCITHTGNAPATLRRTLRKIVEHHKSTYIHDRQADWLESIVDIAMESEKGTDQ